MSKFRASYRDAPKATKVAEIDPEGMVELSVVLRPGMPVQAEEYAGGRGLSHAEYRRRHGTKDEVLARVRDVARKHGLLVVSEDAGAHVMKLRGTYAQAMAAFQPETIGMYEDEAGKRFVARSGHLTLPADIAEDVTAVMGFDQRPVAKTHFRKAKKKKAETISYTPAQVAARYKFPTGLDGTGETVGLIELGGGYVDTEVRPGPMARCSLISRSWGRWRRQRTSSSISARTRGADSRMRFPRRSMTRPTSPR
jgi:kumamolisin